MKTTMKVVNGVRVAASQRDPQGGRSGSVRRVAPAGVVRPTWQEPANMTTFEMTVLTRKGFKMPIVVVAEGVDVLRTTFIDGEPFHPTTAQREVIGQEAFDRSGRVVCAWCKIILAEGEVDAPVSHGICAKCAQEMES